MVVSVFAATLRQLEVTQMVLDLPEWFVLFS